MFEKGKLYLCATPIGNLEDITFRVIRCLKEADLIAAEDTRNSVKLLNHFEIKTPMTAYHEHNKYDKGRELVRQMLSGKCIALITDAGTPGISDPGEELVRMCLDEGIEVTSLPGAAACVTALTISGLSTRRFAFEAFLPSDKNERRKVLGDIKNEFRTIVIYEAPHRLKSTLKELAEALGNERRVSIVKELTKIHESVRRMSLGEAVTFTEEEQPRGEYVLVIEGKSRAEEEEKTRERFLSMSLEDHMQMYLDEGLDKKAAMKAVAGDRGVSKSEIYKRLLDRKVP